MKRYSLLFIILVFLLCGCSSEKSDMPKLKLSSVTLNGEGNYARNIEEILPLSMGDVLDITFDLDGNGADLKSFMLKQNSDDIVTWMVFNQEEISEYFSDIPNGVLGYKDGIEKTSIVIKLIVAKAKDKEEIKISFYLNSKALNCEGASYYMDLTTTTEPRKDVAE